MISISNDMAEEIINVTDALRRMAFTMTDKRSENTKQRAKLIIRYIEKKNGKKEEETFSNKSRLGAAR